MGVTGSYPGLVWPGAGDNEASWARRSQDLGRLPRAGWQPAVPGLGGWWPVVLGTWVLCGDLVIIAVPGDKIGDALFDRGAGSEAHFAGEVADVGDGGGDVAGLHGQ